MRVRISLSKGFVPLLISFISIILWSAAIRIQRGHKVSSSLHVFLSVIILILTVSFLSSCASDETADGNPATVCLRLKVSDGPVTRSLSSTNENTIRDITVLIFDSSSQLIGNKYVDGLSSATGVTATVTTQTASDCTVYAIANTDSSSFFSGVNTIGELNEKCTTLTDAPVLGSSATDVLMEGSTSGVTISSGANDIEVPVRHLCSKVNVSIIPSSDITVTGYRLCNAPLGSYITDSHASSGTAVTSPANDSGKSYGNFDVVTLNSPTAGAKVTIPAYYVYENLAGSNGSTLATDQERTSAKAPTNAMYLLVYAKTSSWHSTYRIYLGGMTNASPPATDYSNFNVYRNRNYSYTVNINGSGQSDARVNYTADVVITGRTGTYIGSATIGNYLYADGTEGTTYKSGQTVGIIYSNELSADEHNAGYTHGKVLALKDANNGCCPWSSSNSPTTYPTEPYVQTFAECYQDITSGYYGTCTKSPSLASNSLNYAWYYCRQYNDGTTKTLSKNSGWYLPGAGDWWDILANLGEGLSTSLASQRTSTTSAAASYLLSGLSSSPYLDTLNTKLTNAGGTPFGYDSGAYYYWSSSEYNGNNAVRFRFYVSYLFVDDTNKPSYRLCPRCSSFLTYLSI